MTCDRPFPTLLSRPIDVDPGDASDMEVIGRVAFLTHRGTVAEAILDRSGQWHCPELPVLDRVLNALYAPKGLPGAVSYGQVELGRVADWFKGRRVPGCR